MKTLTINIDNSTPKGNAFLLYLKSLAYDNDSFLTIENELDDKENELLAQIEAGLKDVRNMKEGKIPEKTLKEMLSE